MEEALRQSRGRWLGFVGAVFVPLAFYWSTLSVDGYWLDAGEFVAASIDLGIAHPPGHPLAGLLGHLVCFLPLGPLALRVALSSALAASLASGVLFLAILTTLERVAMSKGPALVSMALGAAFVVTGSYAFWFQAVRPEVYALNAVLAFVVIERTLAFESRDHVDIRPLYVAALCEGFALANHHFLAFLVLPAVAPSIARAYRSRGVRALGWMTAALLAGLSTYVYLPLRALSGDLAVNLGEPRTFERFLWVVSAKAFQKNAGAEIPQPFAERFADVFVQLITRFGWGAWLLAIVGLYMGVRLRRLHRFVFVWGAVLVVFSAARVWLGFVRSNPDALGYLVPAFAALGFFFALFLTASAYAVGPALSPDQRAGLSGVLGLVALCFGGYQFVTTASEASLARFQAPDALDDYRRRNLPPRAVVLAHAPQTAFRHWGAEAAERVRPDITLVAVPFLTYPGFVERLRSDSPELEPLLRVYLIDGELREPELQTLSAQRPVFVEMDVRVPVRLYETLVPSELLYAVLSDGTTDGDERLGAREQREIYDHLDLLLGGERMEPETKNQLLWLHYTDALYYAGYGDRNAAWDAVRRGLALEPRARELRALREELRRHRADSPIDVGRFLPKVETEAAPLADP